MRKLTCLRQVPSTFQDSDYIFWQGKNLVYSKYTIGVLESAGSVPREVKHFSTWRNRKQKTELSFWLENCVDLFTLFTITTRKKVLAIPLVAASETGTAQTIRVYMDGVVGQWRHLVEKSYKML